MSRVLVFDASDFAGRPAEGCWPVTKWPKRWRWMERSAAEQDEHWLQPIPYLLIGDAQGRFWGYRRSGGDQRLADRLSCGVGGHVDEQDWRDDLVATVVAALRRELAEELTNAGRLAIGPPLAWLYEVHSAVGRVHIGVIHVVRWCHPEPPQPAPGEALDALGFLPAERIVTDERFELWSRLAAGFVAGRGA